MFRRQRWNIWLKASRSDLRQNPWQLLKTVFWKKLLREAGLPVAPYTVVENVQDLPQNDSTLYPGILKVARFGYDGKGQARVANLAEAQAAFASFSGNICVLEKMLKLDYEVSVVLARDANGLIAAFPTAENSHLNGILDISIAPARGSEQIRKQAQQLAGKVAEKLEYTGVLGVEFFVSEGQLLVNEIAPRPHNSGHYTIDVVRQQSNNRYAYWQACRWAVCGSIARR